MKLSEAIRLGEYALPARFNAWLALDENMKPCGGCAVGRTAYAAGFDCCDVKGSIIEDAKVLSRFFDATWPWTKGLVPPLPPGVSQKEFAKRISRGQKDSNNLVMSTMSWAYECERLSLVEIAAYVDTFEPQETCQVEEAANALQTVS